MSRDHVHGRRRCHDSSTYTTSYPDTSSPTNPEIHPARQTAKTSCRAWRRWCAKRSQSTRIFPTHSSLLPQILLSVYSKESTVFFSQTKFSIYIIHNIPGLTTFGRLWYQLQNTIHAVQAALPIENDTPASRTMLETASQFVRIHTPRHLFPFHQNGYVCIWRLPL